MILEAVLPRYVLNTMPRILDRYSSKSFKINTLIFFLFSLQLSNKTFPVRVERVNQVRDISLTLHVLDFLLVLLKKRCNIIVELRRKATWRSSSMVSSYRIRWSLSALRYALIETCCVSAIIVNHSFRILSRNGFQDFEYSSLMYRG